MKKAYEVYAKGALDKEAHTVQIIVERARMYDVVFLQNSTLVQTLLTKTSEEGKVEGLAHVSTLWKWLKASEGKARLS